MFVKSVHRGNQLDASQVYEYHGSGNQEHVTHWFNFFPGIQLNNLTPVYSDLVNIEHKSYTCVCPDIKD